MEGAQWVRLRRALGDPAWADDDELQGVAGRRRREDELDGHLEAWTSTRSPADAMALLQREGVPAGAVQRSSDLLVDPQYLHRDFHRRLEHPEMGRVPYSGHAFQIQGYASGPRMPAPLLGQHSFEVMEELLGMTSEEIAETVAAGAID